MHDNDRPTSHLSACQIGQLHIFLHVIPLETLLQLFVKVQIFSWCALDLNLKAKKSMLNYNVHLILFFRCFKHESYVPYIPKAQLVKQQAERAMKKAQEEAERREREEEERKKKQEDEEKRRLQELEVGAETTIGDSKEEQMSAENTVCCGVHHRLTLLHVRTCTHTHTVTQHHKPHFLFLTSALCVFLLLFFSILLTCMLFTLLKRAKGLFMLPIPVSLLVFCLVLLLFLSCYLLLMVHSPEPPPPPPHYIFAKK